MILYKKMHSNGNNFLLLDNRNGSIDGQALSAYARRDCDVKKGIGADGILVIEKSEHLDFKMRIINANGFESEMCGNGARCIALYAFENGISSHTPKFETLAGNMEAKVTGNRVKIHMGHYDFETGLNQRTFSIGEEAITYQYMLLGVPHVVIFLEEHQRLTMDEMRHIGQSFDQNHVVFSKGTNVNFVRKLNDHAIDVITYERGVEAITDSCGTGSGASALLASERYGLDSPVEVHNIGGINTVYFDKKDFFASVALEGSVHYAGDIQCPSFVF